jgi:outer membrane protein assembly factor BamE (lipoprotein component of BamABCDE complex)
MPRPASTEFDGWDGVLERAPGFGPRHVNRWFLVKISAIQSLRRVASPLAAILLASAVFGCIGVSDTRGNLPLAEVVEEIKPGRHTQREIISMLGSPSTKATYEEQEFWYYIGEKTETLAFFKPNLVERRIIVIQFDKKGVVKNVQNLNESDGKKISIVDRVTPTKGKDHSVLEQILGNVGRFGQPRNREE